MKRMTGFALLTPEQRKERAAQGGRAAHKLGRAPKFEKGADATRLAARKGGEASARRNRKKDMTIYEEKTLRKSLAEMPDEVREKLINGDWSTK